MFVEDGRRFVDGSSDVYDLAIVDAFEDDRVPRALTTREFLQDLHWHLSPEGAIAFNFIGTVDGSLSGPFRSLHRTLGSVWSRVWVFTIDEGVLADGINLCLLATDANVSEDELRSRIADRVGGRVTVPAFHLFGEDLYTGAIEYGDAPLLVDEPGDADRI